VVRLLRAVVVSYRFDDGKEGSCGIPELQRREAAARAEAEELRGQIADLTERLAGVRERLSRLVIARETVDEVLSEAGSQASWAAVPDGMARSRFGHLSPICVLAVPPWRAGLEASALPEAYRDLLEVAEDAGRPLRAGQMAAAGLSTDKAKVEGLRSKLKRLVERGWLAEDASSWVRRCQPITNHSRKKSPMETYAPMPGAGPGGLVFDVNTQLCAHKTAWASKPVNHRGDGQRLAAWTPPPPLYRFPVRQGTRQARPPRPHGRRRPRQPPASRLRQC
jgi:hypothetical protein